MQRGYSGCYNRERRIGWSVNLEWALFIVPPGNCGEFSPEDLVGRACVCGHHDALFDRPCEGEDRRRLRLIGAGDDSARVAYSCGEAKDHRNSPFFGNPESDACVVVSLLNV